MLRQVQEVERASTKAAPTSKAAEQFRVRTWLLSLGVAALGLLVINLVPQPSGLGQNGSPAAGTIKKNPASNEAVLPVTVSSQPVPTEPVVSAESAMPKPEQLAPVAQPAQSNAAKPSRDHASPAKEPPKLEKSKLKGAVDPQGGRAAKITSPSEPEASQSASVHEGLPSGVSARQMAVQHRGELASMAESSLNESATCNAASGLKKEQCLNCQSRGFFGRLNCEAQIKSKFCEVQSAHPECQANPYQ
jgi:hypothetical protein